MLPLVLSGGIAWPLGPQGEEEKERGTPHPPLDKDQGHKPRCSD